MCEAVFFQVGIKMAYTGKIALVTNGAGGMRRMAAQTFSKTKMGLIKH